IWPVAGVNVVVVVVVVPSAFVITSSSAMALPLRNPATSACALASEPANAANSVLSRVDSWPLALADTGASGGGAVCAMAGASDNAPSTAAQSSVDLRWRDFMKWLLGNAAMAE